MQLQNTILEMIAKGETLEHTLERMCIELEKLLPGVFCSISTVEQGTHFRSLAGPSLPAAYSAALDGLMIGARSGSCGSAAYFRSAVVVTDIETDPRWIDFRHLALPLGLRACWSSPILGADGTLMATFAIYFGECRGPTTFEQETVGQCVHLCSIAIDRHQRGMEQERRAFTDELTGLPNRAAFDAALADLDCAVPGAWALFVLKIDNLKMINDTFGHHAGDCLLRIASDRVSSTINPQRMFRTGGDAFAIILDSPATLFDLDVTAEQIFDTLLVPATWDAHVIALRAMIGGAVLSIGNGSAERVRQNADFALYHARETGRGGFVRYWPGLGTTIKRKLGAIRDVDAALRENRIDAYYQPVVRLDTREVVGLEALARMKVGKEIRTASSFHEATTDIHVATALTACMVKLVATDVRSWLDMGIRFQHVGINVSSADLNGGEVERVLTDAFDLVSVPLDHVIVEVTETVYMDDSDHVVHRSMRNLRAKGLRVALDDFGTGYASLTHLMTVPVDIIKIDKSFVDRLAPGDASVAIVEGLIDIAAKLNIRVIAEGIETEDQARQLQALGCVLGQGYLFSHAVDRHATTALLLARAQR